MLDVSEVVTTLAAALNGVFDSQIAGGEAHDLATLDRARARHAATFFMSAANQANQSIFGMDLTPLVTDESAVIRGLRLAASLTVSTPT